MANQQKSGLTTKLQPLLDTLPGQMIVHYFKDDLGTRAAALTYYLIFSIFPLAILISLMVASLDINIEAMLTGLQNVLPASIISLLEGYLSYVQDAPSTTMITFALIFSIYFPWRVVSSLMKTIRTSYGQPPAANQLKFLFKTIIGAIIMPATLVLTLLMFVFGRNVILFILRFLHQGILEMAATTMLLRLWDYGRFAGAAVLMFFSLGIVYNLSLDGRQKFRYLAPGIIFALTIWILASMAFSFYVENFAKYSVIYGTLGGFIILLLWLYLTSLTFILGGALNGLLAQRRRDIRAEMDRREKEKKQQKEEKAAKEVREITELMQKRLEGMGLEQYEIMQRDLQKYLAASREKADQEQAKKQQALLNEPLMAAQQADIEELTLSQSLE
ncbi:YihY family inner membrane protein [Erysipelotrichaceae bacterium RD49]|nr:YihY family inner membrane protein [Erysipelotrichaceae bacterium RD49]